MSKLRIPVPILAFAPFRRLSLASQFMLLGALILLFGALIVGWWINHEIEQQVLSYSARVTAVFVDSSVAPLLWGISDLNSVTPEEHAQLDQALHTNMRTGDFVAFHIARPDGKLIYSSVPISASTNMRTPGMEYALAGQIHSQLADGIDFAPPDWRHYTNLVETYFPAHDKSGKKIIAVASFYQSLDNLQQSILEAQLRGWVVVGIATFLMYVMLFGLVKRGSDTIIRQQQDLSESRQQIQHAAVRAAEVNEDAMRRLGADLHDGPAQDLGIALMRMEPLREALVQKDNADKTPPDAEVIAFDLNLIHTALQSSLQEIRNMASGLRLPAMEDLDLAGAIHKAVSDYSRKTGRHVIVEGPELLEGNAALKSASYRIVQEALNNGHLHGNPTQQTVQYAVSDDILSILINDNGSGFDVDKLADRAGRRQLGLAGLQERAEILGGRFVIESAPGQGTTIEAIFPYNTFSSDGDTDVG
ncbi:MAG: sensor histidine kinase [Chloroflexi bacterium]|nr:sensor histidine kinase [Chloroflexota bacterium]MCL5275198.1 sensor histidine kinase [Chloroflexota bacterium]